jgi:hypothetical protein
VAAAARARRRSRRARASGDGGGGGGRRFDQAAARAVAEALAARAPGAVDIVTPDVFVARIIASIAQAADK